MNNDNSDMEILPSSRQHGTFSADGFGFCIGIIGMTIGRDRGDGNVDKTCQAGWKLVYLLHNGKMQRFRRTAQKTSIVFRQIRVKNMQSGGDMKDMSHQNFASLLKWCANTKDLAKGRQVHSYLKQTGHSTDTFLNNLLINMYSKCGALEDARNAFDELEVRDVITWNIIIAAYAQFGYAAEALKLFGQMDLNGIKRDVISWNAVISGCCQNVDYAIGVMCLFDQMHKETEKPDSVTCVSILGACTILGTMPQGKFIHAYVVLRGIASSDVIFGNALVNMYGKCGDVDVAYLAFQRMHNWNVVSWTSIIACYVRYGFDKEAFQLFRQMQLEEIKPDKVTFLSLLVACSNLTDLAQGKEIHAYLTEAGLGSDHVLGTALVDMYGKCGSVKIAHGIFKKLHRWDVVSWTAMIAGYAMHGYGEEALQLYDQMQQEGFEPNAVTFTSVLSAFGHAGLLDEGYQLYISMIADHRVTPSLEHHGCIVGLLGQDGWLDESEDYIANVPIEADIVSWTSLLGVCGVHKDVKRGNRIAKHVLALRSFVAAPVLSSLKCNQQEVARPKELVKSHRPRSTIEVNDEVHQFFVGDLSHPQAEAIYAELDTLNVQMKKAGYIPDPCLASHDVWEDARKQLIRYHGEKLALAFGLISISSESTLHIIKNTQICSDCHLASKFISNIRNREIVIRDSTHVHRFKNGTCSCGK